MQKHLYNSIKNESTMHIENLHFLLSHKNMISIKDKLISQRYYMIIYRYNNSNNSNCYQFISAKTKKVRNKKHNNCKA